MSSILANCSLNDASPIDYDVPRPTLVTTHSISFMHISSAGARWHFEKRSINVPAHNTPGVGVKPSSYLDLQCTHINC